MIWNFFKTKPKTVIKSETKASYKGITLNRTKSKYVAQLYIPSGPSKRADVNIYIGSYPTVNEAMTARKEFILNLI